jgi:hypothetical protein
MSQADVDAWIEASVLTVAPVRRPAVPLPVRIPAEPANGRLVLSPDMGRH